MRTHGRRRSISDFRYSPLVAALGAALAPQAVMAATYTVTNPADNSVTAPVGSLREAINLANAACTGSDVINFNFPNGPFVSTISQALPIITCGGLTIDGGGHQNDLVSPTKLAADPAGGALFQFGLFAQAATPVFIRGLEVSGWTYGTALLGSMVAIDNVVHDNLKGIVGTAGAIVHGNRVFANTTGIYVAYGGETIQSNVVYDNTDGIRVQTQTSGAVVNNFVGIDDGTRPDLVPINGNTNGVYLFSSNVTVQQNVISGNDTGVYLDTDQGSTISSNKIGTDASGTSAMGNWTGIFSATPNTSSTITNNVISGNSDSEISLDAANNVAITGNFIGSDVTGTALIGGGHGILAACSTGIEVTNNIVTTSYGGIAIEFDAVTSGGKLNIVGNKIGVAGDGVTPLGSSSYGVILRSTNCTPLVALSSPSPTDGILMQNNVIANGQGDGVLLSGANNTTLTDNAIHSNGGFGVDVFGGVGNQFLVNSIYGNLAFSQALPKNINLGFAGGPLPNDAGDVDVAPVPNDGQNYPIITSVSRNIEGNATALSFTLDSVPGTYRIDVYGNSSATTEPGGDQFLGTTNLTVVSGPALGTFTVPGVTSDFFSLLATSPPGVSGTGETSEFSPVANVVLAPGVTASASSIDFGNVAIGSDSPPRTVTITSSGTAPYEIGAFGDSTCYGGAICSSGPFTCTTTCSDAFYAPGTSCQFTATFHPTTLGSFSGTIAICDNVSPFSRTISIAGAGVVPPPVTIIPSAFDFGTTLLRSQSAPHEFTIFNPGTALVSIGAVTASSDFDVVSTTCGTTLAGGAFCVANVDFAPTNLGPISGTLSVAASTGLTAFSSKGARFAKVLAGPAATSALTGVGAIQAIFDIPSAIDFGSYTSGTPAIERTVTLTNNGNAVLSLPSISVTAPFTLVNGCPLNMQPGDSCTLTLDFSASALGPYTGSLNIVSNAVGGSRSVFLTAQTVAVAAPVIRVSPLQVGFGDRLLGTASSSQRVTIANVGNAPATLSPLVLTTTDFLVTTTCGISLAPASSCFADVSFRPVGFGSRTAQLLVAGSPTPVDLSGTGCRPFSSASSRLGASFGCSP
jgi:parallel beta-helix repeat protein